MNRRNPGLAALAGVFALSVGAGLLVRSYPHRVHRSDDAPGRTARRSDFGGFRIAGRTVTIGAPRSQIYEYWREPDKLMSFLQDVVQVEETSPDRLIWVLSSPSGVLEVETRLVEDRKDELIAWRSTQEAEVDIEAKVQLRDAPGGRGTEVEAHVAYKPRGGMVGDWAAKLRGVDPHSRGRQSLKRLKMLLETGEIATADNRRAS